MEWHPLNLGRGILLAGFAFLALAAIVIFLGRMLGVFRSGPGQTKTGGVVPILSLLGVLGFLTGLGLAVCNRSYEKLGLALAGVSFLAIWGSIFLNKRKSRAGR